MARRFIIREFWSMAQFKPRQEGFELNPMLLFWAISGSALIGIELLISTKRLIMLIGKPMGVRYGSRCVSPGLFSDVFIITLSSRNYKKRDQIGPSHSGKKLHTKLSKVGPVKLFVNHS